jgi:hypothetical protein
MVMAQPASPNPKAAFARRTAQERRGKGWIRNSFWLPPTSITVLDSVRDRMGLTSREATLNAILARIDDDTFLRQEFLQAPE